MLSEAGWKCIGSGVASRVYRYGSEQTVLKVSDGDECYLLFVDYAVANWTAALPKLVNLYRGGNWAVTRIEFLMQLSVGDAAHIVAWKDDYVDCRRKNLSRPLPYERSAALDDLFAIAIKHDCGMDLKPDNWMRRGDTIVLTDPMN